MLTEVLKYLKRDDFVRTVHKGTFEIVGGEIAPLNFLILNQFFYIHGSILNDGLYRYGDKLDLLDETFTGTIYALAIPKPVLELADEITEFVYSEEAKPSVYKSESFDGYSYSKADDEDNDWRKKFSSRLRGWRKI